MSNTDYPLELSNLYDSDEAFYHPFNLAPTLATRNRVPTADDLSQRIDTIPACALTTPYKIDARLSRTITFATLHTTPNNTLIVPDTEALYLINGRPHLCLKIEITLTPESGISTLAKGTFIEIN